MFSIKEISELAVQIEVNGEAVYRDVAAKVSDPMLKTLLEEMAAEERQHASWFERLGTDALGSIQAVDSELEAMGRALLTEMLGDQTFSLSAVELIDAATVVEVVEHAAEFERDTIVFYEMLADFVEEVEVAAQLRDIIAEEQGHMHKLNDYLAK